jgi:hypothetical protein
LLELFHSSFGRTVTAAQYRWKLRTRPSPAENVAIAVDDADRPVFHIGGMPRRLRLGGAELWAMVAVDGMTSPAFRRRGILTTVTADLFRRWRDAGIALVLGLPNEQWRSRVDALGWRPLFPLRWMVRRLAPARIAARRLHVPVHWWNRRWDRASGDVVVRDASVPGDVPAPPAPGSAGQRAYLARDAAWVAWRYYAPPHTAYRVLVGFRGGRPVGYAAIRPQGRAGLIADLDTTPEDGHVLGALIAGAARELRHGGADTARALAVPGGPLHSALRRAGFHPSRHAFMVHGVSLDPAVDLAALADPGAWHLTGGDFDVV